MTKKEGREKKEKHSEALKPTWTDFDFEMIGNDLRGFNTSRLLLNKTDKNQH
jgi:hypothetical protein